MVVFLFSYNVVHKYVYYYSKRLNCSGIINKTETEGFKPSVSVLLSSRVSNYAATAGATRATGRDSPAARSRGKL